MSASRNDATHNPDFKAASIRRLDTAAQGNAAHLRTFRSTPEKKEIRTRKSILYSEWPEMGLRNEITSALARYSSQIQGSKARQVRRHAMTRG